MEVNLKVKCRLCQKESKLKYSHIIPEFFYKLMYDDKHRFMQLSRIQDELTIIQQKGLREYLLCENCESIFSKYERYMSQSFYYKKNIIFHEDDKVLIAENVDYKLMKLFQLSILWRASVSDLEIFNNVNLGPHEERVRFMLLNETPGKDYEYGCIQFAIIMDDSKTAEGLIMPPIHFREKSTSHYRFTFGGLIWVFIVSSHTKLFHSKNLFLLESGRLIIHKKPIEKISYITNFGFDLKKQGKLNVAN